MKNITKILKYIPLGLLGSIALLIIWSFIEPRILNVENETARSWLRFTQKDKVYADGWAKGYGETGNQLYVNPGIGMSIVPIRLFCPPELTFFTLETE